MQGISKLMVRVVSCSIRVLPENLVGCQKPFGRNNHTYIGNKKPFLQARYLKTGIAIRKSIVNPC
jgi:hypothetical protein